MSFFKRYDCVSKTFSHNGNYVQAILDEICLEGLDGITFDALLIRLTHLKDFHISFQTDSAQDFLFQILRHNLNCQEMKEYDESSNTLRGNLNNYGGDLSNGLVQYSNGRKLFVS